MAYNADIKETELNLASSVIGWASELRGTSVCASGPLPPFAIAANSTRDRCPYQFKQIMHSTASSDGDSTAPIDAAREKCKEAAAALGATFLETDYDTCKLPGGCMLDTHHENPGKVAFNLHNDYSPG